MTVLNLLPMIVIIEAFPNTPAEGYMAAQLTADKHKQLNWETLSIIK